MCGNRVSRRRFNAIDAIRLIARVPRGRKRSEMLAQRAQRCGADIGDSIESIEKFYFPDIHWCVVYYGPVNLGK